MLERFYPGIIRAACGGVKKIHIGGRELLLPVAKLPTGSQLDTQSTLLIHSS